MNCLLELRLLTWHESITLLIALLGLFLIFLDPEWKGDPSGLFFASLAGFGYGGFLVLTQRFSLGSGLVPLTALLSFGCVYLSLPVIFSGSLTVPSVSALYILAALALLPCIVGFWCTTEALTIISSQKVQIIELIEPVFALMFAFIFLKQHLSTYEGLGGSLIIAAIVVFNYLDFNVVSQKVIR